jgi:Histidine kinase-like ATPase domain
MEGTPAARWFQRTYSAEPNQVGWARRALTRVLGDHPFIDDATLIASEFATNAVLHSASRNGGKFTLRLEIHPGYVRIEVEDAGGPWNPVKYTDGRPHGFDVIEAIVGTGNWGIDGDAAGRVAWAALGGPLDRPGRGAIGVFFVESGIAVRAPGLQRLRGRVGAGGRGIPLHALGQCGGVPDRQRPRYRQAADDRL